MLTAEETQEAKGLAWEVGRLKYKLQPKQREAYDLIQRANPKDIFCLICHRGFGKTFIESTLAMEIGRQGQDSESILIISATLKKLRTIVKPAFNEVMRDCPEDLKPTFNTQDSYWQFPTGVRAHLVAAERGHIEDIRGIHKVRAVLIDEAAFFGDEESGYPLDHVINAILIPMFIRTESIPRIIISTTPPETPSHPVKQIYQQACMDRTVAVFDCTNTDVPKEKIDEIIERMLKVPGGDMAVQREMYCKWVIDKSRLIIPEWDEKYVRVNKRDDLFQYWDKYFSLDTGSVDKTVGHLFYYDFARGVVVFEDEIVYEGREWTTDQLAAELKAKEIGHWGLENPKMPEKGAKVYRRTGDSDNQILLADMTLMHKLAINPTTKDTLIAMVNKARLWVKMGRVEINPRCKLLIQTMRDGIWNKSKDEFARTTMLGHMDAMASFIYGIRNIDEVHNPVPTDFGYDKYAQIRPTEPKSKTSQGLEHALVSSNPFLRQDAA